MKFDTTLLTTDLSQMPTLTPAAEAMGFDALDPATRFSVAGSTR